MLRSKLRAPLFVALLTAVWQPSAGAGDLPTADEILQIHRLNEQRLANLHLQLVYQLEYDAAHCRENGGPRAGWFAHGQKIEFFRSGSNYQVRTPAARLDDEKLASWNFPEEPLTPAALTTTYRDASIFSRSEKSKPATTWWPGKDSPFAYLTQKHLSQVSQICLPPSTDITEPRWGTGHPFDDFFSQPAEKYRVVRNEIMDGRSLVVVDVEAPIPENNSNRTAYRGWVDLERGALLLKLFCEQTSDKAPRSDFDLAHPSEIVSTQKIYKLPNGAFYPSKTVREGWTRDPKTPKLTKAEWKEFQAGKRKLALVVFRRETWDCSLVRIKKQFEDGFFVIPFPPDQKLFDHDAGKLIGARKK